MFANDGANLFEIPSPLETGSGNPSKKDIGKQEMEA
jgi:hypothetical protein